MEQTMDSTQIEEIWTTVSHYIPERQKLDCAVDFVKTLISTGYFRKGLNISLKIFI